MPHAWDDPYSATGNTGRTDTQVQAARTRLAQRLASLLGGSTP